MIEIKRPRVRTEETADPDGNKLDTRTGHLMSDGDGNFPIDLLNQWEIKVLDKEIGRSGFQAWYRNPSRPSGDALAIAYPERSGPLAPDVPRLPLLPRRSREHEGLHRRPSRPPPRRRARPKLRGLAEFAATHGESFHRIESVAQMKDGTLRVLDLTDTDTRNAIAEADDTEALYLGGWANDY